MTADNIVSAEMVLADGKKIYVYAGSRPERQKVIDPLRTFGNDDGEHIGVLPYIQWQQVVKMH